jgi:glucosamine 6-phosphate synthetase-like amidotransferase/phosphosugar isomerase protein
VIGHNRMASAKYRKDDKNLSNPNNAQPFESSKFVTVHNGTMNMPRIKGYEYTSDIDSESIIAYADKLSLRNALSNIDGAATVVAYDKKNKKIFFWTNGERPLAICLYKGMIFFASTKVILRKMLSPKTQLNIFQPDISFTTIYEDELLEFDLQKNQFSRRGEIKQKVSKEASTAVKSQINNTYFQPVTSLSGPRKPLQRGCTANPPAVQQNIWQGSAEDDPSPLDNVNGKDVKKSVHLAANGAKIITYHTK